MNTRHLCHVVFVLFLAAAGALAADDAAAYLKDGKLTGQLEIMHLQGGVAGFTGRYCRIEPDGSWSTGSVAPVEEPSPPKASGKLTADELARLAAELAKQDLVNLKDCGRPMANPRVLRIRFAEKHRSLYTPRGAGGDGDLAARFQGIDALVNSLCRAQPPVK